MKDRAGYIRKANRHTDKIRVDFQTVSGLFLRFLRQRHNLYIAGLVLGTHKTHEHKKLRNKRHRSHVYLRAD